MSSNCLAFFSFPYVTSIEQLKEEVKKRKRRNARKKWEEYLTEKIKISKEELEEILSQQFKEISGGKEVVVGFPRQIQTASLETLVVTRLLRYYNIKCLLMELTSDLYTSQNPFKRSLVNITIRENRKTRKEKIANPSEGEILRHIKTKYETKLPEYHHSYMKKDEIKILDNSNYFSNAVGISLQNGHYPRKLFVQERKGNLIKGVCYNFNPNRKVYYSINGNEISIDDMIEKAYNGEVRPPADWYYKYLYLPLFGILMHHFVLIETPFEEEDKRFQKFVRDAYEEIRSVTSTYPLIIPLFDTEEWNSQEAKSKFGKYPGYCIIPNPPEISFKPSGKFYIDSKEIAESLMKNV